MRSFNEFEKTIIKKIITTPFVEFDNLKNGTIKRSGIALFYSTFTKATVVRFTRDSYYIGFDTSLTEENMLEERDRIIDLIALVKYLKENNYLYIFLDELSWQLIEYKNPDLAEAEENGFKFASCYASQDLQNFFSASYHPTSALVDLAQDFKTPEMRIAEKNIKVAWWAIGTAVFTSLISIIIQICK